MDENVNAKIRQLHRLLFEIEVLGIDYPGNSTIILPYVEISFKSLLNEQI